ncbi:hypothetical protein Pcinc_019296 [Petrolisthes cinctipes]|uniref:Uncharacterized protein n=1 Tax=Petrolisthes cinctipes TaxID=88211 RepID=A0AAE1FQA8_PETCI|nr:hypothetical protein Pcinc_019296 [Petrolisthes cinctipes]
MMKKSEQTNLDGYHNIGSQTVLVEAHVVNTRVVLRAGLAAYRMASCKVNDEPRSLESIGGCKGEVVRAGLREKEESGGYQLRRAGRGPHLLAAERRTSHCLSQPYEPHRRPYAVGPPRAAVRGHYPASPTHQRTHAHTHTCNTRAVSQAAHYTSVPTTHTSGRSSGGDCQPI